MAWCGAAQKECAYLGNLIEVRDNLRLVEESSLNSEEVLEAGELANTSDRLIEWTKSSETAKCNEEVCAINAVAALIAPKYFGEGS